MSYSVSAIIRNALNMMADPTFLSSLDFIDIRKRNLRIRSSYWRVTFNFLKSVYSCENEVKLHSVVKTLFFERFSKVDASEMKKFFSRNINSSDYVSFRGILLYVTKKGLKSSFRRQKSFEKLRKRRYYESKLDNFSKYNKIKLYNPYVTASEITTSEFERVNVHTLKEVQSNSSDSEEDNNDVIETSSHESDFNESESDSNLSSNNQESEHSSDNDESDLSDKLSSEESDDDYREFRKNIGEQLVHHKHVSKKDKDEFIPKGRFSTTRRGGKTMILPRNTSQLLTRLHPSEIEYATEVFLKKSENHFGSWQDNIPIDHATDLLEASARWKKRIMEHEVNNS